jgi:hypothetical protein
MTSGDGLPEPVRRYLSHAALGEVAKGTFSYLPFGADIHEERRFGDLVIPSRVTAGWNYGTERYNSFFKATITTANPA